MIRHRMDGNKITILHSTISTSRHSQSGAETISRDLPVSCGSAQSTSSRHTITAWHWLGWRTATTALGFMVERSKRARPVNAMHLKTLHMGIETYDLLGTKDRMMYECSSAATSSSSDLASRLNV